MHHTGRKLFHIIPAAILAGLAAAPAAGQVPLEPLDRTVDRTLERPLPRRLPPVEERLDEELESAREAAQPLADELPDLPIDETVGESLRTADELAATGVTLAGNVAGTAGAAAARLFELDVDPFGNAIEKNVLMVLVEERQLRELRASGLAVLSERPLVGLGMTMVKLEAGSGYGLARKALELERTIGGAAVDFNHLYRFQQSAGDRAARPAHAAARAPDAARAAPGARIGLIDSAVDTGHPVLQDRDIERRDFVPNDAARPTGHGTAVASLLAEAAGDEARILSASVFFQLPGHAPGASTESLVAALDWLAQAGVDAVNMSLAGPDNDLLERALAALANAAGPPVVAAVGNNGPSGEPLYPGAYPTVIGVTAVDREERIFRYANRGEHVDFAALGVNVKVANVGGGWRIESGTSMASPRVAAFVAALVAARPVRGETLIGLMKGDCKDLGQRGFDPVFGHGLLAALPSIAAGGETPALTRTTPED